MSRQVTLFTPPAASQWAVRVGETWYEIAKDGIKRINDATSGVGSQGGELAGETSKTDVEIHGWIDDNKGHDLVNCQKLALEFKDWLTADTTRRRVD